MGKIIGIDLGTTHSLCAVFEDSFPRLIPNSLGEVLTPSVVGILEGKILVGQPARELAVTQPENCAWAFKRHMGTEKSYRLGEKEFSPPELSSLILKSLKEDAQRYLKEEVEEAVITVPAYFNEHQRRATKIAGEMAGLKIKRIINEPTAAALTYGFHDREGEKHLLVFDLGGGTFDVTLMEIFEGALEIISTAGENFLGGSDFTDALAAWICQQAGLNWEVLEMKEPLQAARLRELCERAKKEFAQREEVEIPLPNREGEVAESQPSFSLSRQKFAQVCQNLLDRLSRPLVRALRDGGMEAQSVDEIILVGGATRMPLIQNFVGNYFSRSPKIRFNPDEVVALGASVQTALIRDDRAVEDLVMTDVCPFTLGISVVKMFGNQMREGYFLPIIHRNTTIPVSREEVVSTIYPNQREIVVKVYQGESRKVEENLFLGELKVSGLPPGPVGTEAHVRFTYDLNGILEVEAYVPKTGKKFNTVLTHHVQGLSQREIEKALAKLEELKFYPRDDLKNRNLVLFCEKIIGEINPYERQDLERALDAFESAMVSGDREFFEMSRQNLLILLSRLGFEYEERDEL